MSAKTITGSGIVCYINNAPWAVVTDIAFTSATPRTAHYGLDSLDPFELSIQKTRVTYSLGIMRTIGDAGAEGAGLVGSYEALPREKYFSIRVVDRVGGFTVFESQYCSVVNQSYQIAARGVMTGKIEIEALDWNNESLV
jgi:hypothetical protein